MKYVLNILITTGKEGSNVLETELYPIAFKTIDEVDHELLHEGYTKLPNNEHRIKSKYIWKEEGVTKNAWIEYTSIG